jgi:ABC-type spermidine/putrescine transport system permease subunit II
MSDVTIQTSLPPARPTRRITAVGVMSSMLWGIYLLAVIVLLVFPIVLVVLASFQGKLGVDWSLSNLKLTAYQAIPAGYWQSFWFTIKVATIAACCSLLISFPAAWAMVRGRLWERRIISNLVLLPDIVPQLIMGIALLTVFIPLRLSNSFPGVLLALVTLNLAMGLRFGEALLEGLPEEYELAAESLGASKLTALRVVVLPLIAPGLAIAALFIFMQNLIAFVLLFFIAGPDATPISIKLFTDIVDRGVVPEAIAMSGMLVYVALIFYAIVAMALGPKYMAGALMSRKG